MLIFLIFDIIEIGIPYENNCIHTRDFTPTPGFFSQFNHHICRLQFLETQKASHILLPRNLSLIISQKKCESNNKCVKTDSFSLGYELKTKLMNQNNKKYNGKHKQKLLSLISLHGGSCTSKLLRSQSHIQMNNIYEKHVSHQIRDNIKNSINEFRDDNFKNKFVLGIHLRQARHYKLDPSFNDEMNNLIIQNAKEIISNKNNYVIFICSNLESTIKLFKDSFPDGKVISTQVTRVTNKIADWTSNTAPLQEQWKDVFIDASLLARCDHLLGGPSNVFYGAMYLSKEHLDKTITIPDFFPNVAR